MIFRLYSIHIELYPKPSQSNYHTPTALEQGAHGSEAHGLHPLSTLVFFQVCCGYLCIFFFLLEGRVVVLQDGLLCSFHF